MTAAAPTEAGPSPSEIRAHLSEILESPHFRASRRCHDLLAFLVERVLEGHQDGLKERVIGVEIFGRPTDYDPASDPIVRVSVGEVRKRLAQYYQEAAPSKRTPRIHITTGHYVPDFSWGAGAQPEPIAPKKSAALPHRRRLYVLCGAILFAAGLFVVAWAFLRAPDPVEAFWGPALRSRRAPLILSERYGPGSFIHRFDAELRKLSNDDLPSAKLLESDVATTLRQAVMAGNVFALRALDRLFLSKGQDAELRVGELSTTDLAERPVVLIGYFNNPWAKNVDTEKTRFTLTTERQGELIVHVIHDAQDPKRQWSISSDRPWFEDTPVSYAIVTRIYDARSGRFLVSIAGMTHLATSAAAEFLTHASYLQQLQSSAPRGWEKMNIQAVIQTNIVNQTAAPPKLLTSHFW